MPRSILIPRGTDGVATYQVPEHEEWQLLALTATIHYGVIATYTAAMMDCRSPTNNIIFRQVLGNATSEGSPVDEDLFVSLAPLAESFLVSEDNVNAGFAQTLDDPGYTVTASLALLILTPGCTVNLYVTGPLTSPAEDPITQAAPGVTIHNMHLWVEDTAAKVDALTLDYRPLLLRAAGA